MQIELLFIWTIHICVLRKSKQTEIDSRLVLLYTTSVLVFLEI